MSLCHWTLSVKSAPLGDQTHLLVEVKEATGAVLVIEGCKALDGPVHVHGVSVEGAVPSKQHPVGEGPTQEHLGEGWAKSGEGWAGSCPAGHVCARQLTPE